MSLNFYFIQKQEESKESTAEPVWDIRKTARHEVPQTLKKDKWFAQWDENGRYFLIQGIKTSAFDKSPKYIKFYNMFGELLEFIDDIVGLDQVIFRPRAKDSLN